MANPDHLELIKQGAAKWNEWRQAKPHVLPNLRKANLQGHDLVGANFNDTNLRRADLRGADLSKATFRRADLRRADLSGATLANADFTSTTLVETNFENATLDDCLVYGIAAWNVNLKGAQQRRLVVSKKNSPTIAVDNLEVAQFVYLLVQNQRLRDVIHTMGQRAVLILGRFTPASRKSVLDGISDKLRTLGYLPVIFDFERPPDRDFTETIRILAGLSLFVIVDITNPRSSPLELQATVPDLKIPFVPIIEDNQEPFAMFKDLTFYDWMLKPVIRYGDPMPLIDGLYELVVAPALKKHAEITKRKAAEIQSRSVEDLLRSGTY